jgi:hypothetical protein
MDDIERLAKALEKCSGHVTEGEDYGWPTPSLNVLDCVLSLNRRYDAFVLPRVEAFAKRHPEIRELAQLLELIKSYESAARFSVEELNYNDPKRAGVLVGVIEYLIREQKDYGGVTEQERLREWAVSVRPSDVSRVGVRGFGLSGFQYLRMLFGAQTAKPDVHIRRFVSDVLGERVGDWRALALLEEAAKRAGLPLRSIDYVIWESRSGRAAAAQRG